MRRWCGRAPSRSAIPFGWSPETPSERSMRAHPFADAPAFIAHIGPGLAGRELQNNLLLGVLRELISKPDPSAFMLSIDEAGQSVLAAVMTPPLDLVVSTGDPTAVGDLVDHLCRHQPRIPGVFSLAPMAEAFADAWRERTGQAVAPGLEMKLYALADVPPPDSTPGSFRCARSSDRVLLGEWTSAFFAEAGLSDEERRVRVAEVGDRIDRGTLSVVGERRGGRVHGRLPGYDGDDHADRAGIHAAASSRARVRDGLRAPPQPAAAVIRTGMVPSVRRYEQSDTDGDLSPFGAPGS